MRSIRSFSLECKRQVVEELLSGEGRPAQVCQQYNITPSLRYHWKKQYSLGKFNNEKLFRAPSLRNPFQSNTFVLYFILTLVSIKSILP